MLFLAFLWIAAIQDFFQKQVKLWVFVLFGVIAIIISSYLWISQNHDFPWKEHLGSCCLGTLLLGAGKLCNGEVGSGDGLFFMVSGTMLGFGENLALLCSSIALCGIYSLIYLCFYQIQGRNMRKATLPFLPFALLPGTWLVSCLLLNHHQTANGNLSAVESMFAFL